MRLEGSGGSAFEQAATYVDPFRSSTSYHRMAQQVMSALNSNDPREIVANVRNGTAIRGFGEGDVVEVICDFDRKGPKPRPSGALPAEVQGLAFATKAYERATIDAAMAQSATLAKKALLLHPSIGD
jgi:6-phospho-beta-glucosidase